MICSIFSNLKIPDDLESRMILDYHSKNASKKNIITGYCNYNTDDPDELAYIENLEDWKRKYGESGGVYFYEIEYSLKEELKNFLHNNGLFRQTDSFYYQKVGGGSYVGPHIDHSGLKKIAYIYVIDPGGKNVETVWYEPKKEFQHLKKTENTVIPYEKLNELERHKLEPGIWYVGNYSIIHGVQNLETDRITIFPFTLP